MDKRVTGEQQNPSNNPTVLSRRTALKRMAQAAMAAGVVSIGLSCDEFFEDGGSSGGYDRYRSMNSGGGPSGYSYQSNEGWYTSQFTHTYASINMPSGNSYNSTNLYASSGYYTSRA